MSENQGLVVDTETMLGASMIVDSVAEIIRDSILKSSTDYRKDILPFTLKERRNQRKGPDCCVVNGLTTGSNGGGDLPDQFGEYWNPLSKRRW